MTTTEYNSLVQTHSDRLLRYALKLTLDYSWSQDLVQESLIKLWSNKSKVTQRHAGPFLYRVLYNKMIDDKRKQSRVELKETIKESGSFQDSPLETKDLLDQAFSQLNFAQKQIIMLRDWEGYSYDEIGEILEQKTSLVKVHLFRARKKMKAVIHSLTTETPPCYENN